MEGKMMPDMKAPAKDVESYLAALPEQVRAALEQLRKTIREAALEATEGISYRIPVFKDHGHLVGFSASKNHCGFHTMSPPLAASLKDELKGYVVSGATIHFSAGKPLPADLVKKIVKARMEENRRGESI